MPRMIDLIRASAVPYSLMQAAARGALSVTPDEMIEILVHLGVHNKVLGEQARMTLAGWDEKASLAAASNPSTSPEVLDYLISPDNLRPVLLPSLLENPSVKQESLVELASTGSRGVIEALLQSPRAQDSAEIQNALRSNPNLREAESKALEVEHAQDVKESLEVHHSAQESEPDSVLDEALTAYLNEHAHEIESEGDKPFQPLGGVYEEVITEEEPLSEPATPTTVASATGSQAAAAPHRAPVKRKSHLGHEEERGTALQKIARLDIKGRIQLAMKGTKEERSLLIRDGTKIVALAVLDSPKISDSEVEKFASQKNVLEAVLRGIPLKRRFAKNYAVVRNLVFNPRTPLDVSLGLMKHVLVHDLRHLSGNKEVSETVRKLATKMFKQKSDTSKKGHE